MQVRVFEAMDMATGLKMIKKELGPDALILSTRTIRNGKLGLMGKPVLEITAAIDSNFPHTHSGTDNRDRVTQQRQPEDTRNYKAGGFRHVVDDSNEDLGRNQQTAAAVHYGSSGRYNDNHIEQVKTELQPDLQNEVNELKDLVKNLAGKIAQIAEKDGSSKQTRQLKVKDTDFSNRYNSSTIHGDHILSKLIDRGINVETSRTIARFLRESLTDQELGNPDIIDAAIMRTIEDLIQVSPPTFTNKDNPQLIALVGPTGVGKTTTLAKIAASYLSKHSHSVALITIDTYRIAAVEQLKVYGEIMHLPVDVVITPEQLEKAIDRHRDKELILIDTAGRSPRDSFCINELAAFLKPELNIDKHLVLSATTREHELLDAIVRFQELGITHTIFTKIDECANLGILLNVQIQNANPLSYFTNGQRVPEDLLEASPKTAAELIMSQKEGSMHD
ncbi:MAG: flagellar biosynthesis protein FlhF [Proteobacteria bacterium]|nr:flagellar biosynthesis protein FlhF [Pseudomonadota bacterium]